MQNMKDKKSFNYLNSSNSFRIVNILFDFFLF